MESTISAPPTTKQIDWQRVRELYLQEIPHKQIAEECGVTPAAIRCRAYRHGWKDEAHSELLVNPPPIQELIQEWSLNMALSMIAGSRFWVNWDNDVKCGKDARDWEQAKQLHINSGRALFGLDRDDRKPGSWTGSQGNVIDVTPVAPTPIADAKPKM